MQLKMFHSQFTYQTVKQAQACLQAMCPEVRSLFSQTEQLVRLLLVCPASSCTAERSFRALRRLKTWLRNNMTQKRLNHVSVCHVYQDFLDSIDPFILAQEFAGRSEIRRNCSDPLAVHRSHSSICFMLRPHCLVNRFNRSSCDFVIVGRRHNWTSQIFVIY